MQECNERLTRAFYTWEISDQASRPMTEEELSDTGLASDSGAILATEDYSHAREYNPVARRRSRRFCNLERTGDLNALLQEPELVATRTIRRRTVMIAVDTTCLCPLRFVQELADRGAPLVALHP